MKAKFEMLKLLPLDHFHLCRLNSEIYFLLQKVLVYEQHNNGLLEQATKTLAEAQEGWEAINLKCKSICVGEQWKT
jgi:hypothetical protein